MNNLQLSEQFIDLSDEEYDSLDQNAPEVWEISHLDTCIKSLGDREVWGKITDQGDSQHHTRLFEYRLLIEDVVDLLTAVRSSIDCKLF